MSDEWVWVEETVPARKSILGEVPAQTVRQKHRKSCVEAQAQYEQRLAEFEAKYPNYCRTCRGTGILEYTENMSPHGSGRYWPMQMSEPCDDCLRGCPRCGYEPIDWTDEGWEQFFEGTKPCPECGMVIGDPEMETAPYEPECDCWLYDEFKSEVLDEVSDD